MPTIRLCNNCLETGAKAVTIGYAKGSQFDPTYDTVDLCSWCEGLLKKGKFSELASRQTTERTINIDSQGGN
jgi:hypothetical protein